MDCTVKLLGVRGSASVSGREYARYGGATTCILAGFGAQRIVLDAGTGLMNLREDMVPDPVLPRIRTHPHADHLLGLPLCPFVMRPGNRLDIYSAARNGLAVAGALDRLMSPPLWPVGLRDLPGEIALHTLPARLQLGDVTVTSAEGCHPGGVSILRLEGAGASLVLMTDCTVTEENRARLAAFAADCDLLLIDGQYSAAEWPLRSDYGHNTWLNAAAFGRACGAKRTLVVHHDPFRTDGALDAAAADLARVNPTAQFAREGAELTL